MSIVIGLSSQCFGNSIMVDDSAGGKLIRGTETNKKASWDSEAALIDRRGFHSSSPPLCPLFFGKVHIKPHYLSGESIVRIWMERLCFHWTFHHDTLLRMSKTGRN